jgi:septum formation protein
MLLPERLSGYKVFLASQSPRRKQLLEGLGLDFEVLKLDVDETFPEKLTREQIAIYLSKLKADEARKNIKDKELFITADTIVWLGNQVLNKPSDQNQAKKMLHQLSGKMHEVITAVSIGSTSYNRTIYAVTEVYFKSLTEEEINFYVEKYKPLDKAGAYGVQEWIGYIGVEHMVGSFYNVMGLPIRELYEELMSFPLR